MKNLDYGIIGNCRSAALISKTGSIVWCCLPEFDSPSIFASLLDKNKGGSFDILTDENYTITQKYLDNTSILLTSYTNGTDAFEVADFMPRYIKASGKSHTPPEIIRYFRLLSGKPVFKVHYDPKLEYALGETENYIKEDFLISLTHNKKFDSIFLYSSFDKQLLMDKKDVELTKDGYFIIGYNEKISTPTIETVREELEKTHGYWSDWAQRTTTYKKYNTEIARSAITLKLLSYEKTGAILAAATTSLPETIQEVRNWDYRFCWIRDASMVIKIITQIGHRKMAQKFIQFIIDIIPDKDEKLQIMYGINREKKLTEEILPHLSGYENSRPVRIGNAAFVQRQNDIYGILMDVIHQQIVSLGTDKENGEELWDITKGIVWVVNKHWREPDKGIWEFRTEEKHFTFSKVLCWVALDRAIKVAIIFGKQAKAEQWKAIAEEIKEDILKYAWNDKIQAFTQYYGAGDMDAAVLLMEPYGFIEARDPKYMATVWAIERELSYEGLLYRYKNNDDFGLPSSSFTICTFWFISSLFKIGEHEKAVALFEKILSYSNHLGLFSEDIDFKTKRLLGNFPQAYSHLALIETAIHLSELTE